MRQATVVSFGLQGAAAELLQALAARHGVWVRDVQQAKACRHLLRTGGPAVLVLKLGRDLEQELALLEETSRLSPDTATVVVGDTDHPAVAGLAWDLGARYVLFPPQPVELLGDIVFRFLGEARGEPR